MISKGVVTGGVCPLFDSMSDKVYKYRVKFKRKASDLYEYRYFDNRIDAVQFLTDLVYNEKFYKVCYSEFRDKL